jgi:class 3 adenylate cyclase
MASLQFTYALVDDSEGIKVNALSLIEFQSFNSALLGLGNISKESEPVEALAAIFDLEGFTSFCSQIDPQLVIPDYLSRFLEWLFETIGKEFQIEESKSHALLWARLPFFAKFMGDGVLFLWDTKYSDNQADIGNIVVCLKDICDKYKTEFLPSIHLDIDRPPVRLRCGLARGQILSIGDGKDYVGPCINMASRLQKIESLSFAFPRKGFDIQKCFNLERQAEFMTIRAPVRGVGDGENIVVLKSEWAGLNDKEKDQFTQLDQTGSVSARDEEEGSLAATTVQAAREG